MPTTSHALFSELIDYAGIFPPAALSLEEAFRRFLNHRDGEFGWLLARFVCPASRLSELAPMIETAELGQTPIRIAVLGAGGDDPPAFAEALERDTAAMKTFAHHLGDQALIDVFELRLITHGDVSEAVDLCFHTLEDVSERPPRPFFEIPMVGNRPDPIAAAMAVAAAAHEIDPARRAGLKIRCGGLEASAVPTVESVASAITSTVATGLALKATQGLHHPLRGEDAGLGTTTHGFFNLLTAAALAYEHFLDEETVAAIVAEEDPETFRLDDSGLHWRDLAADFSSIFECRMAAFAGFGSCSFTEPRDDLADLGWIGG